MRNLILAVTSAILLGSGVALTVQATRAPSASVQAIREPSPEVVARELLARELSEATATLPAEAVPPTPMTFRQVRSVPVVEPAPNAPTAEPPETRSAHQAKPALGLDAAQGRTGAKTETLAAEATSTPPMVMPRRQKQRAETTAPEDLSEEVSSSPRRSATRSHARPRYVTALVRPSGGKRRVQPAAAEEVATMPAAAMAYDGKNENHSPFHSLGKVFGGAQ